MQKVAPSSNTESGTPDAPELHLLPDWREPDRGRRILRAGAGSLVVHVGMFGLLLFLLQESASVSQNLPLVAAVHQTVTLIAPPPTELTQRAPNHGRVSKEFNLPSPFRPPVPAPTPALSRSIPAPPAFPEPPKLEAESKVAEAPPPALGNSPVAPPPPPEIQPAEHKPKLAFETPGATTGVPNRTGPKLQAPKTKVDEVARAALRGGPGSLTVGDADEPVLPQLPAMPSLPRQKSSVELLSDPMGVDFKPYLIQVLTAVRRNWFAVIPESARMGRRGRVVIQFIIDRDGHVPKLVIAVPSGTEALDRAAVTGVSASHPFPPLPAGYRADTVRLQLVFSYNMSSQ